MNKILIIHILCLIISTSCTKQKKLSLIKLQKKSLSKKPSKTPLSELKIKTHLLDRIIADDKNYLEVHPANNVVVRIEQFKQAEQFWLDTRFKHVGFETWDMHIIISQDGTVAWYYCMLNDLNDWDGQFVNWENTRWVGVLKKRNGSRRIAQMRFSYPSK